MEHILSKAAFRAKLFEHYILDWKFLTHVGKLHEYMSRVSSMDNHCGNVPRHEQVNLYGCILGFDNMIMIFAHET